jgi:catalase
VGSRLGAVRSDDGEAINVDISLEAGPSVLYDGVVIPDGDQAIVSLLRDAHAMDFVRDQYRHCKPMLVLGEGINLLLNADIPLTLPTGEPDGTLIQAEGGEVVDSMVRFEQALAMHRQFLRETDPPVV